MAKLSSMMENDSNPMQETVTALESSFSDRLLHPKCVKERYHRSFLPAAVKTSQPAVLLVDPTVTKTETETMFFQLSTKVDASLFSPLSSLFLIFPACFSHLVLSCLLVPLSPHCSKN